MGSGPKSPHRDGGVETYPADAHDIDSYRQAEAGLTKMRIPVLLHADNPHERLFIAALDGTGNSMFDDKPENWSVVAKVAKQIEELETKGIKNIAGGYVEGTFTQTGFWKTPARLWDGRFGHTFDERVETAYFQLCTQAKAWLQEDPQAQIRVAGVGFSRGAEEVAALQLMVHERGIRDTDGAKYAVNDENLITRIRYADRPLLVAPGKTLQAALLFDPVSTGVEEHDRCRTSSTRALFKIIAEDERRDLFKSSTHIPPGFSDDARSYSVTVGGSHSDVGDTYPRNGLGILSFNLGVAFLNRLSDRDYLEKQAVPDDLAQFVVHRSDQHMYGLYGTRSYDQDGVRDRVNTLAPGGGQCPMDAVRDDGRKEPIDEGMEVGKERRSAPTEALPQQQPDRQDAPRREGQETSLEDVLERLYQGALVKDDRAMSAAANDYLRSPAGLEFRAEVALEKTVMEARERQAALEAQEARQQAQTLRNPHVMRM